MASIYQEIHCPKSGGGCGGYVLFKLSVGNDRKVIVVCPKCKHEHTRCVQGGRIVEKGRYTGNDTAKEYLRPMPSAWSEKPRTVEMPKAIARQERDAVVITDPEKQLIHRGMEDFAPVLIRQSWIENHGLGD